MSRAVLTKPCAICGEEFQKHPSFSKTQWEKAKFCSRICWGVHRSELFAADRPTVHAKWESLFDKGNGCWNWKGTIDGYGYGVMDHSGKRYRAHVLSLVFDGRPLGEREVARHRCDNAEERYARDDSGRSPWSRGQ